MLQKNIDKKIGFAVACGQVDSKPRVIRRNRTEYAVFLRPQSERSCRVCGSYTKPFGGKLPAVPNHGFETPGSTQKLTNSKKIRRTIMSPDTIDSINNVIRLLSRFTQLPDDNTTIHKIIAATILFDAEQACFDARRSLCAPEVMQ